MNTWHKFIQSKISLLPVIRTRLAKIAGNARFIHDNTQQYLNFVSNDYLGLSQHSKLINAAIYATKQYGTGSTGAASLSGYSQLQELLSKEIAAWLGYEKCLLFNSGYQLNSSLFSQLVDNNIFIWLDNNCHASHIDGVLLSRAKFSRFTKNDTTKMRKTISQQTDILHIIVTEGIFSMDGTNQDLKELVELKKIMPEKILLIVDDAHGIGTIGINGRGILEDSEIDIKHIDLLIGTFGKAFGSHGGFLCGSRFLIEYLQQSVRSQIFSTCLPPAISAANLSSLSIIKSAEGYKLRQVLTNNIQYFQKVAKDSYIQLLNHNNYSAIQLVSIKEKYIQNIYQDLFTENILIGKILYPTVAKNKPRLRISLNVLHERADIEFLLTILKKSMDKHNDE